MLEMKISITATDLAEAINNLATALDGRKNAPSDKPAAPVAQPATPAPTVSPTNAPVQQTPAPTMNPTAAVPGVPGVPLSVTPAQTVAPAVPANPAPVSTAAPTYTLEMIATAGTALVDAGKMDALCNLLSKYSIDSITKLDPSQYGAFATELRALGAQI